MSTPIDPYREAQLRAEQAAQANGMQAPGPLNGESVKDYRVRLASHFQQHSPEWKTQNLNTLAASSPAGFGVAERQIYDSAIKAGNNPVCPPGTPLYSRTSRNESGHLVKTFFGDPVFAWRDFVGGGVRFLTGINRRPQGARRD
jgi:hypothetical protein